MKNTRKILSAVLAIVMVLALSLTAFAATNTITIKNAQKDETYTAYKMLDLVVSTDNKAFSYTVNSNWTAFFTGEGAGASYVTITNGYVTMKAAANMADFAKAAAKYATDNSISGTAKKADDNYVVFDNLEAGYYLITSTNGTKSIVDTANGSVEINEKNTNPTIEKQVQEDSNSSWGNKNDADTNQTVNYKVTINAKPGAKNYVLHDKMESALKFNAESVEITGLTKGTDYTVVTGDLTDDCTFEIRFAQTYLDSITTDTTLTVTYSATLDKTATTGTAHKNAAQLTWGDKNHTEWDKTETYTWGFKIFKHDSDDKALAGAKFVLYKGTNESKEYAKITDGKITGWTANKDEATVLTSPENGYITIEGLDSDTYYVEETEAPAGYNKLASDVKVEIKEGATDSSYTIPETKIENKTGAELPSTGGIGTTIFYVVGSLLVVGAAIVLITRRRMNAEA